MLSAWREASCPIKVGTIAGLLALAAIGFVIGWRTRGPGPKPPPDTVEKPFEFLYIDLSRVGAYLAQLEGGTFAKQTLSEKVTNKVNGEVSLQSVLKAGASSENENFVQREVTPTAASLFVTLKEKLKGEVEKGFLRHFRHFAAKTLPNGDQGDNEKFEEGDFVRFRATVRIPAYIAPYLTVHHEATMRALFPDPRGGDPRQRASAQRERKAAREFEKEVGRDPRFLFDVDPVQKESGKRNVTYLMPARLRQLNEERSLLSSGGAFTVVGKVTRIFMPWSDKTPNGGTTAKTYSYVDSLTRELWKDPLVQAPRRLICISSLSCATAVEEAGGSQSAHRALAKKLHQRIESFRRGILTALRRETEIKGAGAVIVPIAIYR